MALNSPMLAGWELGIRLREARAVLDMTAAEAAVAAGITQNYLSNVERGRRRIADDKLVALLDVYAVADPDRSELLELRKSSDGRGWWSEYGGLFSPELIRYYGYEHSATEVHTYEGAAVSGLLQTESYARAIHAGDRANLRLSEVEQRIEVRMRRQQRLHGRDPIRALIVMSETAIRQLVGGHAVLTEQLEYLLRLIDTLPNLDVRIIPFSAGAYGAMVSSTFHVLTFPNRRVQRLAWHENVTSLSLIDNDAVVHQFELSFQEALGRAADRDGSIDLIKRALGDLT